MTRVGFALATLLALTPTAARADTLPIADGLPDTYTPGQSFTFTLHVPNLPDLTSYQLDIIFETEIANPPLIAFPTVATPAPLPERGYVFTSNANFSYNFDTPSGSSSRTLSLMDFTSPPVTTRPGENDLIGTVTVVPDSTMTGDILISFLPDFQYNFREGTLYGPPDPHPVHMAKGTPVPAPPGALLLAFGGLLVGIRTRLRHKPA